MMHGLADFIANECDDYLGDPPMSPEKLLKLKNSIVSFYRTMYGRTDIDIVLEEVGDYININPYFTTPHGLDWKEILHG